MKSIFRLPAVLLAALTIGFAAVPDEIRQSLDKLLPEAIRLIEAKEFVALLEAVVPPEDFRKITAEKPLPEFAARFGEEKAARLLAVLKAAKNQKPKISEDGNTAIYTLPEGADASKGTLVFMRIENRWYIKN